MTGVPGLTRGHRILAAVLAVSTATLVGGLTAIEPVFMVGVVATAIATWCLAALPPLMLAVAVHKGVWNVAPVIEAIGQEAPTLALIGLTILLLVGRSASRPLPALLMRLGLLTAVFIAYGAIGAFAGGGLNSTDKILRLAIFIGWGFLLACLIGIDRRATIVALALIVVGAVAIALASVSNWISLGIPNVFGENWINFGRSVGVGAVIALGAALVGQLPRTWRVLSVVVGLALAVTTVASGSRGAVVSIIAAGTAMFVLPLAGRGKGSRALTLAIFACLGTLAAILASGSAGFERFVSLGNVGDDVPALLRAQAIQYSFAEWLNSPLFGVGLRDLQLQVSVGSYTQVIAYPHNMIIETLSQTGIMGFLLLSATIALPIVVVLRQDRLRRDPVVSILVGVMVFYVVAAQFSGDLEINRYVWTFVFLLAATPAWLEALP